MNVIFLNLYSLSAPYALSESSILMLLLLGLSAGYALSLKCFFVFHKWLSAGYMLSPRDFLNSEYMLSTHPHTKRARHWDNFCNCLG